MIVKGDVDVKKGRCDCEDVVIVRRDEIVKRRYNCEEKMIRDEDVTTERNKTWREGKILPGWEANHTGPELVLLLRSPVQNHRAQWIFGSWLSSRKLP